MDGVPAQLHTLARRMVAAVVEAHLVRRSHNIINTLNIQATCLRSAALMA